MFQLALMITLLLSVSKSIKNGYSVESDESNSYILNKKTKKISKMKKPLALMSSLTTVAKSTAMERATLGRLHLLFSKLLRLRRR